MGLGDGSTKSTVWSSTFTAFVPAGWMRLLMSDAWLKERSAELNLSATFLLPDGRVVTPPSLVWTPSAK